MSEYTPVTLTSLSQLRDWLKRQQVDLSKWGEGDAKTVVDLWTEVEHGECTLYAEPLLRRVDVVEVLIHRDGRLLIEREQHFADGRLRVRNRPPSEKLHPGEAPMAAALRCLCEELALSPHQIVLPVQEIAQRALLTESGSYPNLKCEYRFYTVYAEVDELPSDAFITPNSAHGAGDPVIAHGWIWV